MNEVATSEAITARSGSGRAIARIGRIASILALNVPVALVLYLVVGPIVLLLLGGFKPDGLASSPGFTLSHYVDVYSAGRTYGLLLNTMLFATGSTVVTLFFSISLAWIIERTNIPFKSWLRAALIAPMAVPVVLVAMSWVLLASPEIGLFNRLLIDVFGFHQAPLNVYSLPGMIFVQGITLVPGMFLLLCFTFRNMDPALEEASLVSGVGPISTLRRVVLPLLLPGILAVAILTFMVGVAVFDIAGVLGLPAKVNVLSLEIFLSVQRPVGLPDFGRVSALASLFLVLTLLLSYIYNRQTRMTAKFTTISGREFRPRMFDLGKWKYVAILFIATYLLLAVGLPLAALIWQSLIPYYAPFSFDNVHLVSMGNYGSIASTPMITLALTNTIVVATVTASALVVFGTVVSWIIVRSRYRARRLLDVMTLLPLSMPHIMLGLALIYVYLTLKAGIYGTVWILVIAFVTAYMTYAIKLLNSTMFQIHKELEEVAQVSGASWSRILRTIIVPLLAPNLVGLWIWVIAHSMRELSAAVMLQSRANLVLTTLLWTFWERGDIPRVATLGVVFVVILFLIIVLGQLIGRRFQVVTRDG